MWGRWSQQSNHHGNLIVSVTMAATSVSVLSANVVLAQYFDFQTKRILQYFLCVCLFGLSLLYVTCFRICFLSGICNMIIINLKPNNQPNYWFSLYRHIRALGFVQRGKDWQDKKLSCLRTLQQRFANTRCWTHILLLESKPLANWIGLHVFLILHHC